MLQGAYTSEAWATLVKNPQNRTGAVRPVVEKRGHSRASISSLFAQEEIDRPGVIYLSGDAPGTVCRRRPYCQISDAITVDITSVNRLAEKPVVLLRHPGLPISVRVREHTSQAESAY